MRNQMLGHPLLVTPFAGVWIEIHVTAPSVYEPLVTPFAGVWIEMSKYIL